MLWLCETLIIRVPIWILIDLSGFPLEFGLICPEIEIEIEFLGSGIFNYVQAFPFIAMRWCIPHGDNLYTYNTFHHVFQTVDSDRRRPSSSRNGSTSRKAFLSSSRGSGDPSDPIRSSHLVPTSSGSSRPSTNQRLHQSTGLEGRTSSLSKPGRVVHDDPTMRNFERLTISADRRKWNFY